MFRKDIAVLEINSIMQKAETAANSKNAVIMNHV